MEPTRVAVQHAGRAKLAGWLMVVPGVLLIGDLILGAIVGAGSSNPWTQAFLPFVIAVGLLVAVPPTILGIGILKHSRSARWIGILAGLAGVIGSAYWLFGVVSQGTPPPGGVPAGLAIIAAFLAASLLELWALATSGDYFGSRYSDLMYQASYPASARSSSRYGSGITSSQSDWIQPLTPRPSAGESGDSR
jgi:hypothetical protein